MTLGRFVLKTIGIDLWGGQVRSAANNRATMIRQAEPGPARDLRTLFVNAYGMFAPACRECDEPGVALIAIDERTGRAVGLVRSFARVERTVAVIVGRHNACDLYLDGNDALALRHLAIVLDPAQNWKRGSSNVHYRIIDLRTTSGFEDESGRTLRAMRCEGPAMIRCGGYAIFALPIGDPTDWPASADDAWSYLPERVYF